MLWRRRSGSSESSESQPVTCHPGLRSLPCLIMMRGGGWGQPRSYASMTDPGGGGRRGRGGGGLGRDGQAQGGGQS